MSSAVKRCAVLVMLFACTAAGWFAQSIQARQAQTVSQGVYTDEQAKRGEAIYKDRCASCHGETLAGRAGPPLTGDDFVAAWNQQPLSELFSKIRNTMPQDAPGKLTGPQTADLLAFMLRAGKFPAGRTDLSTDEAALKQISWPAGNAARPRPASPAGQAVSFPPAGNLSQVMRGILFPNANIIFTVQTHDPAEKKIVPDPATTEGGFNFVVWGSNLYSGWELVDYAAVALAESAPLMLTPGRRCENGKPVPVDDPDWLKFTMELAEAGKAAYKASQSRNQEAVSDISNQVSESCMNCHQVFRDRRRAGRDALDPSNKANRCMK